MAAPVPRKRAATSASRAYDEIKLMAVAWQFRPGERLNEVELAQKLSLSRTPVRDALTRLAAEGFVKLVPNKGFYCRGFDPKHVYDLYEMRSGLERLVALLVCERASEDDLATLERFVEETERIDHGNDPLAVLASDEEFHSRLAELSGNQTVMETLQSVASKIHFVRLMDMKSRRQSVGNHRKIVTLLKQRRGVEAADALSESIMRRRDDIADLIKRGIGEIYIGDAF
ncbi:GntR family transcriptional regulator [Bosea thiooxidans]